MKPILYAEDVDSDEYVACLDGMDGPYKEITCITLDPYTPTAVWRDIE